MSEDSKTSEEIDPIEVEINLINELIGENIIVVLHQNGMTVMMDEDIEERTKEQMRMFSRLYVATKPSFVLRFFLILEIGMLVVWEYLEDFYTKYIKR